MHMVSVATELVKRSRSEIISTCVAPKESKRNVERVFTSLATEGEGVFVTRRKIDLPATAEDVALCGTASRQRWPTSKVRNPRASRVSNAAPEAREIIIPCAPTSEIICRGTWIQNLDAAACVGMNATSNGPRSPASS